MSLKNAGFNSLRVSFVQKGNLKKGEHHLQYLSLKQRVAIVVLCPEHSLFI